uniref:Uncharacterized protein n=1 Tax=Rhizophora mucronata TaxID=61149 RepID=A0A2P2NM46_RHIMU
MFLLSIKMNNNWLQSKYSSGDWRVTHQGQQRTAMPKRMLQQ